MNQNQNQNQNNLNFAITNSNFQVSQKLRDDCLFVIIICVSSTEKFEKKIHNLTECTIMRKSNKLNECTKIQKPRFIALRALGRSRVRTATPLELTVPLTNSSAIDEMGRKEKEDLEREYENEQRK